VFIPAGSRDPRSAELLGSARFADFLAEVGAGYDAVVLDSSPLLPVSDTRELLPHVDAVILCARAAQTTREQATAARAALAHFPTGLVITGVRTHADEYGAYSYAYDEA
jgi:tyrosine-protein kinase Etk/Wzc